MANVKLARLNGIYKRFISSLAVVAAGFIVIAMIIVCVDVVMRYFLNRPQLWVAESTTYILVWFTFLSAAWILRKEGHVRVGIVADRLNSRQQMLLGITVSLIGAIISILVVIYGTQVVVDSLQRHVRMETTLALPRAPLLAIIPFGSLLLFIQFLKRGYGYLEKRKELADNQSQI